MKKSLSYIMPQVEYTGWSAFDMNKPGANGFALIMDFGGGFNPLHFLNPKPVIDLATLVEGQWRRRLKVALIVDMPSHFKGILNTFLMFVKETTRSKIKCVPTMEEGLQELEKMGCDEETLAYAKQSFLARRNRSEKQTYHPIVDYSFFRERLADLNLSEDTDYLTEEVHTRLREAIQEFRIHRWGIPSTCSAQDHAEHRGSRDEHKEGKTVSFEASSRQKGKVDVLPSAAPSRPSLTDLEAPQEEMMDLRESPSGQRGLFTKWGASEGHAATTDASKNGPANPDVLARRPGRCGGGIAACFGGFSSLTRKVVPCAR